MAKSLSRAEITGLLRLEPSPTIMDPVDIAWVAGIVEGEGHLFQHRDKRVFGITVNMTDLDICQRLAEVTGMGTVSQGRIPAPGKKTLYTWQVSKRTDALRLFLAIAPLLGARRRERLSGLLASMPADYLIRWR